MEKTFKAEVFVEDAIAIEARLKDFEGTVDEWKTAVYELFRLNMTFRKIYRISVDLGNKEKGVYVTAVVDPSFERLTVDHMTDSGFRNISVSKAEVGVISCMDVPDNCTDVEDVIIDW